MTVWIAQCLCPSRHCIMANAGEAEDAREAEVTIAAPLREAVVEGVKSGVINPWCGLCKSRVWTYELGRTRFRTMAEAMPALKRVEGANIVTAALWGDMPRSD